MNENGKTNTAENRGGAKTWVIALSVLVSVVLFIGALWTVIYFADQGSSDAFDYETANLSRYVTISPSDYRGYEVEINVKNNVEKELQHKIMRALAQNKGAMMYNGNYVKTVPIAAGDKAYIWYEAYELSDSGEKIYFTELSNFDDGEAKMIYVGNGTIGSNFYLNDAVGFELGLIGAVPAETGKFVKVESGGFESSDVIYCTADYELESGEKFDDQRIIIDLSDPDVEKVWGRGIAEHFLNKPDNMAIGITDFELNTFYSTDSGEAVIFTQLRPDFVTRSEGAPLTVSADIKPDYSNAKLAGKTIYFDVFVEETVCYERAVWGDELISEKLGYTAERLASYEGETLTEKYENMQRAALEEEYIETCNSVAEDAIWEHLISVAKFKQLPEKEVTRIYDNYVYALELSFATTNEHYESFDLFARSEYGLEDHESWQDHLRAKVEKEVKEQLIFYTIIRNEDLLPDDEEYELIYKAELEKDFLYNCKSNSTFKYYGKTKTDFESAEAYEAAISEFEGLILEDMTEGEYRAAVFHGYATSKIIELANVTNLAEGD